MNGDTVDALLQKIQIPRMAAVRQRFERSAIADVQDTLRKKLAESSLLKEIADKQKVAVAVGSRGINQIPIMVRTLVEALKEAGGDPFIIPAMGSHGGATAEGQVEILSGLGITEDTVGAPILATMDVVEVGSTSNGLPVFVDTYAFDADAVVIINRIKPHVAFRGKFESGLMKMITIGLGKQKGAETCHQLGFGQMAENIPAIGRVALKNLNIPFSVGILENAYHETCRIEIIAGEEIPEVEPELQEEAKRLSPRLYFDSLDVLIIDEIGKDISGTGFDTNVVGRFHTPYASGGPDITKISVLDITEKSHGNANGLGIVDFTTERVFNKFRSDQTYPNSLTSTVSVSVKIPMILKNDRQAIQAAIKTCNIRDLSQVRMARITNTLNLEEIQVSENLLDQVQKNPNQKAVGRPRKLSFDEEGNLF